MNRHTCDLVTGTRTVSSSLSRAHRGTVLVLYVHRWYVRYFGHGPNRCLGASHFYAQHGAWGMRHEHPQAAPCISLPRSGRPLDNPVGRVQ